MDEYISREETAKAFCEKCKGYYDGHCIHRVECDIDVIQTAPAADVQPVRYGQWIWDGNKEECICSECGKGNLKYSTVFCPDCGARNDGNIE